MLEIAYKYTPHAIIPPEVRGIAQLAAEKLRLACRVTIAPIDPFFVLFYGTQGWASEGLRSYEVRICPVDTASNRTVETVAHELRHVYQMEAGRLNSIYRNGDMADVILTSWDDGPWRDPRSVPWAQRPWEIDAVKWSHEFCMQYIDPSMPTAWTQLHAAGRM